MDYWSKAQTLYSAFELGSTFIVIAGAIYTAYLCVTGFLPALIRLGNGLRRRKIAIFAKGDALESLEALFTDSALFRVNNIIRVSHEGDFGRAEKASVFLVYWPDWTDAIPHILDQKRDSTALVIYAPQAQGFLPAATVALVEQHRHVVLANFRGRLLNDIVVSLITSGYDKK